MEDVVKPDILSNESTLRTDSSAYNDGTMSRQLIHEEVNSAYNHAIIIEAFKSGRAMDVSDYPKRTDGCPAFIIGSGPSLDHSIKFMKDWNGAIFCSTSHALTFMRYGIEPDFIVALDPFSTWEEIEGVDWSKTKTILVAQPGVWPSLISNWPNKLLLYIQNNGKPDSYYATTQKHMYSEREEIGKGMREVQFNYFIKTEVTLFACSPPIQMFIAEVLGYKNIFLAGVDFAFHKDKERFTSYTVKKNENDLIEWEEHIHPFASTPTCMLTNNGLYTEQVHLYYKKNMLSAWRLSKQTVYTTDHGSITEVPYSDITKVIKKQGRGFPMQSGKFISCATEKYLAGVGAFVIETKTGLSFVESAKPSWDLVNYMFDLSRIYGCGNCHGSIKINDFNDHNDSECPICKIGKIYQSNPIDIPYNINKIIHYLEMNGIVQNEKEWYDVATTVKEKGIQVGGPK